MPRPTPTVRAGTLYVVATPIGNLDDITLRALNVLKAVNLVAAEDTRHTGILLRHYDITTPVLSVHEHNERGRVTAITSRLAVGESVALVTDAGYPAISDPGAILVGEVRAAGFRVEPIPGASAVITALSAAGLVSEGFTFLGFPPIKAKARNEWLQCALEDAKSRAVVFYEAPHRVLKTLDALSELVERPIVLARELTKVHEEFRFGLPVELIKDLGEPRGEFTVIIPVDHAVMSASELPSDEAVALLFGQITATEPGLGRRQAVKKTAEKLGRPSREIYSSLERSKLG